MSKVVKVGITQLKGHRIKEYDDRKCLICRRYICKEIHKPQVKQPKLLDERMDYAIAKGD